MFALIYNIATNNSKAQKYTFILFTHVHKLVCVRWWWTLQEFIQLPNTV